MPNSEDYKNNPLYTDITKLDHLSPSPNFGYRWSIESGRWEPATDVLELDMDATNNILIGISGAIQNFTGVLNDIHIGVDLEHDQETHRLLSGISGSLGYNNDEETHKLLSGISGALGNNNDLETHRLLSGLSGELSNIHIGVDLDHDTETHRLLSGLSGELSNIHIGVDLDHDTETHRLLSGISGELSDIHIGVDLDHDTETHKLLSGISSQLLDIKKGVDLDSDSETHALLTAVIAKLDNVGGSLSLCEGTRRLYQPWKLRTKTVKQKIEEDFILMEDISHEDRYGYSTGVTYGSDRSLFDDIYGTYFDNGRMSANTPEEKHPNHFIHAEYTDPNRGIDKSESFHTDTLFSMRQENVSASLINSYELEDFNEIYKRGHVDNVTIFNHSVYPIQFHTSERRLDDREPVSPKTKDLIFLDTDMAVKISNDEAGRIFVKRPHTISGFSVTYSITYKETGRYDVIPSNNFNSWKLESDKLSALPSGELPEDPNSEFSAWELQGEYIIPKTPLDNTKYSLWHVDGDHIVAK
jgi:hypothetical protein